MLINVENEFHKIEPRALAYFFKRGKNKKSPLASLIKVAVPRWSGWKKKRLAVLPIG
jgi:hypothetical protein